MKMKLAIPFSPDVQAYIKARFAEGIPPAKIALIFQLAELTGSEPDAIHLRYEALEAEVKRVVYGT